MIPAWKLRRELLRLTNHIVGLPATLVALPGRLREPARRAAYARDFDTVTQLDTGAVPFGKKPAIYLIYQPNGIAKSSLAALDWLTAHGYSPIVVSNAPLQEQDMPEILRRSSLLLRRPNFGYDFGGYKDGIKLINRRGVTPERVIIMNDSVWLPMAPDLMERLEQRDDADILGLLEDEKIKHDNDGGRPSGLKHVESYFYMISAKAWQSEAFQTFWRDYLMTDSKPDTIKNGEIGFSRTMVRAGLTTGALTSREVFLKQLADHDNAFLAMSLSYASYGDTDLRHEGDLLQTLPLDSTGWREKVLDHMRRCVNRKRFNTAFCYASGQIFGTLFLKKNNELVFSEMRRSYVLAVNNCDIPKPPHDIMVEINDAIKSQG